MTVKIAIYKKRCDPHKVREGFTVAERSFTLSTDKQKVFVASKRCYFAGAAGNNVLSERHSKSKCAEIEMCVYVLVGKICMEGRGHYNKR
jgi:hypothetical protein